MKNKIFGSVVAVGLAVSVFAGAMSAHAFAEGIITVAEAAFNTIAQQAGNYDEAFSNAYYENVHRTSIEGAVIGSIIDAVGLSSVKLANYTFFSGKYSMVYLDGAYNERQIMVECSMYYRDDVPSNIDDVADNRFISDGSGRSYLANNLYFDIWNDSGYHKRYRYHTTDVLTMSQMFHSETWSNATGFLTNAGITMHRNTNGTYYDCTDSPIGVPCGWSGNDRDIKFYYRDDNCIWVDTYFNNKAPSYRPYSQTWFMDENGGYTLTYPMDEQICKGYIAKKSQSDGSASTGWSSAKYFLGFFDTNSPQQNKIYAQNNGSPKSNTFIYNYDTTYTGDTIIDNSNKNTILDGTLNTAFDSNGNVILPVDLDAKIAPLIAAGLANLDGKLTNFFDDMPDWGDLWTNRNTDNNYYQLDFPEPELPPSTGDINITVDITRPLIPEVNTNPHVSFNYPTVSTTALPPSIISAGGQIVSVGKDITDMCGTTNLIVVCGLIGVGVMLIFKDW